MGSGFLKMQDAFLYAESNQLSFLVRMGSE